MEALGRCVLGLDIGATKIIAALFSPDLTPLGTAKIKTAETGKAIVDSVVKLVDKVLSAADVPRSVLCAVGAAVAAPLDRKRGVVLEAPNMGLSGFPLGDTLSKALGLCVTLENDVQCGVSGELRAGALQGYSEAAGVFVGTGIGGALVLGGKLYRGSSGTAGEFGHMIVLEGGASCGCGGYGHLEALASRSAMAKDAAACAAAGKAPLAFAQAGTDLKLFRSSVFAKSFESGESEIIRIVDRSAHWLGVGLANIVAMFNPQAIVIGGGVVNRFGEYYRKKALASMEGHLMPTLAKSTKLLLSTLGDLAVPTGAAIAAMDSQGLDVRGKRP